MKRRGLLIGSLVFLLFEGSYGDDRAHAPGNKLDLERIIAKEGTDKSSNYNIIKNYLQDYCKGYVEAISPFSSEMRKNIEFYSRDEKGNINPEEGKKKVIEGYLKMQLLCLALAQKFANKEIPDKEHQELGEALTRNQKENYHDSPFNLETDCLKKAYEFWGKEKVKFFKKLLEEKKEVSSFEELARKKSSRLEYSNHIERLNCGLDEIYDALIKSFKGPLEYLFGKDEVNRVREKDKEYNLSLLDRIYPPEKTEKSKQEK